ncbi:MAG: hypothetical protein HYX71_06045 [Opitutae bacterium]|nr:hypothetical protein [Opitutae bacterium]
MKTSTVSPTLLALVLLALPAAAQTEMAAADTPAESGGRMKKNHQELIRRHDKNGDGRLDDAEKAAAHAAMRKQGGGGNERRKQILKRFDKDGDGQLDDAEQAEAAKFRAEQVKKFDRDGDGQLNDAERATARRGIMGDQTPRRGKKGK